MAVSDFRVQLDFFDHPKAIRLEARLGGDGVVALWRLWAWAAKRRTDGVFDGLTDADVELAARWHGTAGALVDALLEIRFLDRLEEGLAVHGWAESQPWVVGARRRSEKARQAGKRSGEIRQSHKELGTRRSTPSPTDSSTPSPSPSPSPSLASDSVSVSDSDSLSPPVGSGHGYQTFVDAFDGLFRTANEGAKPTWGPKQGAMVKGLLVKHGLVECLRRARRMFEAPPAWLVRGGGSLTLQTLVGNFDAFASDAPDREPGRTNAAGERARSALDILTMRTPVDGGNT